MNMVETNSKFLAKLVSSSSMRIYFILYLVLQRKSAIGSVILLALFETFANIYVVSVRQDQQHVNWTFLICHFRFFANLLTSYSKRIYFILYLVLQCKSAIGSVILLVLFEAFANIYVVSVRQDQQHVDWTFWFVIFGFSRIC